MTNLTTKLVKIMQECAYVQKNGTNEFHKYSYATSADVLDKINSALTKHNVCSVACSELVSLIDVTTAKGNLEHLATVKVAITLIDADSGEQLTITGIGSGQDSGDKAVMKAQTAAIKYAYLLSMAISTGDDPEADSRTDETTNLLQEVKVKTTAKPAKNNPQSLTCQTCNTPISDKVFDYSVEKFGHSLCMTCQRKAVAA